LCGSSLAIRMKHDASTINNRVTIEMHVD
jgi:hypothetical protein